MRTLAFLIPVFALAACDGANQAVAQVEQKTARTMTVSGLGEVSARPDMAVISIGVEALGANASDALGKNSAEMNATVAKLKELGITDKDMQTANLSIYPRYDNPKDRSAPQIIGFAASNTLNVKLRDLSKAGELIDAVVQSGANRLGGISFGFADAKPLLDKARVEAVTDASEKATLYAKASGVRLGSILSIQDGYASAPSPQPIMMRARMSEASAPPIAAGEATVSASITIVYEIQ